MSSINAVILAVASKAQQKKQKTAAKVAVEAALEADRKAKCLLFEKEHRINTKNDLVMPPTKQIVVVPSLSLVIMSLSPQTYLLVNAPMVEMDMLLILRELDQIGSSLSNMKVVPFLE
jgi:hypothetical protein